MLWRYRQAVGRTGKARLGWLTAQVGVGYFFVWTVFGMAAFPLGVALAALEMQQPELARAVPITVGVVVLLAGALQFTAWKARHLACCREAPGRGRSLPADAGTAWRHGLHCSYCGGHHVETNANRDANRQKTNGVSVCYFWKFWSGRRDSEPSTPTLARLRAAGRSHLLA
jgi:predicted metal-binding integral membrane protein DUF2182